MNYSKSLFAIFFLALLIQISQVYGQNKYEDFIMEEPEEENNVISTFFRRILINFY